MLFVLQRRALTRWQPCHVKVRVRVVALYYDPPKANVIIVSVNIVFLIAKLLMLIVEELFTTHSVDQCYGKQISAVCAMGQLLRVVTATYRQTPDCSSSSYFESEKNCSREAPGDAPCTGNATCHFLSRWIYLSSQCGYSNNFIMKYQCIPGPDSSLLLYLAK